MEDGKSQGGNNGFSCDTDAKGYGVTCAMPDSDMADAVFGVTRWDVPVVYLRNMAETRACLLSGAPDEQKRVIREAIHHAAECCYHTHRGTIAARYLRALADCARDLADKAKQLRHLGMLCEGLGELSLRGGTREKNGRV